MSDLDDVGRRLSAIRTECELHRPRGGYCYCVQCFLLREIDGTSTAYKRELGLAQSSITRLTADNARLTAALDAAETELRIVRASRDEACAEVEAWRRERDQYQRLRAFWLELSDTIFHDGGGDIEYGDFLDLGMKHGLIKSVPWNAEEWAHVEGEDGDVVYTSTIPPDVTALAGEHQKGAERG